MLFIAEFEMLPNARYETVVSNILSWEKALADGSVAYKVIGRYGYYGARKGFFIVETNNIDNFYHCIRHFRDVYLWNVKPIHPLQDFNKYNG